MKENIQQNSEEVAIVIYDAPLPPKYFRLKKRFLKNIFIIAPLLTLLIILISLFWGLGHRLKNTPAPSLPIMSESERKIIGLEKEVHTLKESNNTLIEKLSTAPAVTTAEDPYLMMIKKPYGMQNLLKENKLSLDQIKLDRVDSGLALKFQIISNTSESRVSGHVVVFMVSENGIAAYPEEANTLLRQGIKFSSGESFSLSRLRPTKATFINAPPSQEVRFIIYIFNREGDLLLIQETESFKLEKKL